MKPFVQSTSFGFITIDGSTYEYDVLIRAGGNITKRKKKLSKKVYGTSHIVSLDEADFIYEEGISKIIIGCGQNGILGLSDEASNFFNSKHITVVLEDTPTAVNCYNKEKEPCVGLFHVTC